MSDDGKPRRWTNDPLMAILAFLTLVAVGIYAEFAREQVNATAEANRIATAALTEANKPYVNFSNFSLQRVRPLNGQLPKWVIGPVWTNYGNSSASHATTVLCDPIIRETATPPNMECKKSDAATNGETVIGPKQSITYGGKEFTDEQLKDTATEKTFIYLAGYISYTDGVSVDALGKPKIRETWFCQRLVEGFYPRGILPSEDAPPPLKSVGCPVWNCSDEACNLQK